MSYQNLLSPFQIGPIRTRNRIVSSPHGTCLAEDNLVSDANVAYYREKARGGAAVIITESMRIHPTGVPYAGAMALYDPRNKERLPRITEAVHAEGALAFAQLNHAGRNMRPGYNGRPLWSASPLASPLHGEEPHEMDLGDIREVIAGFADCAARAHAAGFDGVEVHGAHGYLLQQFLSPWCNRRGDEYGGSLDNRLRFTMQVLEAVRAAVPASMVVGVRISAEEWIEEGLHLADMTEVARRIAATGWVHYIHVSTSTYHPDSYPNQIPDMHAPMARFVPHAAAIKKAVSAYPVAVFAVGRIHTPDLAEAAIAEGHADMIAMARQLVADPEWPRKVEENRIDEIRSCIACNQGCIGRLAQQLSIRCLVNPAAGREKDWGSWTIERVAKAREVMVIGGGPAGLEAARVAALRGHSVTLLERESRIGGQVNAAILAPGRQDFAKLIRYLGHEVNRLGVKVRTGTTATAKDVLAASPDAVVVATGGTARAFPAPGKIPALDAVVALRRLSAGELDAPRHALVVDEAGQFLAYGIAEALAAAGSRVDIITAKPAIGWHVPTASLLPLMKRLQRSGVQIHTSVSIGSADGKTVLLRSPLHAGEIKLDKVDLVVYAQLPLPDNALARDLRARMENVHVIGDCSAPRGALEAMSEGHRVGRAV